MKMTALALALAVGSLLAGCGGKDPCPDANNPDCDTDVGTDPGTDPTTEPTGPTGTPPPAFLDPCCIGFSYDGAVKGDGTLSSYNVTDYQIYDFPPLMIMEIVSLDYFYTGSKDEVCTLFAVLDEEAIAAPAVPCCGHPEGVDDTATMHSTYNMTLLPILDPDATDCDEKLDPKVWGPGGSDLLNAFDGAHFGMGFGRTAEADWLYSIVEPALPNYVDYPEIPASWFAMYFALNAADGDWQLEDWTLGTLFEWDEKTEELTLDGNLLVRADISKVPPPGVSLNGYIRGNAIWYQDLPLLDLDNLDAVLP